MRAVIVGLGAVGSRAARQVSSWSGLEGLVVVDRDRARSALVAEALGGQAVAATWQAALSRRTDVVVLTQPGEQGRLAREALGVGADVISTSDQEEVVTELIDLDGQARGQHRHVVVGAGFSPGLSCLLVRHGAGGLDTVDEIRVARSGSAGPACAADYGRLLSQSGLEWREGSWARLRPGTGRELCWFPEPVGGVDCRVGRLVEPLLLMPAFPGARRISARAAAGPGQWLTSRLPGIRLPRPEGEIGAVRVELRGTGGGGPCTVVLGALDRPGVAAGTVAAVAARWAGQDRLTRSGAGGLAALVGDPAGFLRDLGERGVRAAVFDPTASSTSSGVAGWAR